MPGQNARDAFTPRRPVAARSFAAGQQQLEYPVTPAGRRMLDFAAQRCAVRRLQSQPPATLHEPIEVEIQQPHSPALDAHGFEQAIPILQSPVAPIHGPAPSAVH